MDKQWGKIVGSMDFRGNPCVVWILSGGMGWVVWNVRGKEPLAWSLTLLPLEYEFPLGFYHFNHSKSLRNFKFR